MKIILLVLSLLGSAKADEISIKPSLTVGLGFSATLLEEERSPVYGLIQAYAINFGGDEGGLRFLGLGVRIDGDPSFIFTPAVACINDKYCMGPHFGDKYIGLGFSYSFGF